MHCMCKDGHSASCEASLLCDVCDACLEHFYLSAFCKQSCVLRGKQGHILLKFWVLSLFEKLGVLQKTDKNHGRF